MKSTTEVTKRNKKNKIPSFFARGKQSTTEQPTIELKAK